MGSAPNKFNSAVLVPILYFDEFCTDQRGEQATLYPAPVSTGHFFMVSMAIPQLFLELRCCYPCG